MVKWVRRAFIVYFCLFWIFYNVTPVKADSELDETRKLLQQSLTIIQIDQEIARLTAREGQIGVKIGESEQKMAGQQDKVAETRKHVGNVLRAYYMGERESVWMLVFSARSFTEALDIYEYLSMIYMNDRILMGNYQKAYQQLQETRAGLLKTQTELQQVKAEFVAQRDRMTALQKDVDEQLKLRPEAMPALLSQIEELKKSWNEKVLPLFKSYLSAISVAMQSLPEILAGENRNKYLSGSLTTPTFKISDKDFSDFLRGKNPRLGNLEFRFTGGQFVANGKDGDVEANITGHYTVEQDPNRLQFHVDALGYNGTPLDLTTNRALENEFDLSFTPEKYIPLFQAAEVSTNDGIFEVKLKFKK